MPSESSSSWPEAHLPVRQLNTAGEFCAKLCQSAAAIAEDKLVGRTGTGRERGGGELHQLELALVVLWQLRSSAAAEPEPQNKCNTQGQS